MARTKKTIATNVPTVKRGRKKHITDNEVDLLGIIVQSLEGMSEDGKHRTMKFLVSKYNIYLFGENI